jgi:hypothetical protein
MEVQNMNRHFYNTAFLNILVALALTACASPTIRDNINIRPIISKEVSPDFGINDAYMIGGLGRDWAQDIFCSPDGSYLLFGETHKSFGESTDFLAVRVSSDHRIVWAKTYGGPHKDSLERAISTRDGGYLMLGSSQSLFFTPLPGNKAARPLLVKISQHGAPQWAITLDGIKGTLFTILSDVQQTKDGGYVLAGQVRIETGNNSFKWNTAIVKLTQNGEPLWAYSYDQRIDDIGKSVKELADGSLIIMGFTLKDNKATNSFFMLNTDATGLPLWAKSYSSTDSLSALSSLLLRNDDLLIIGRVDRSPEDTDFFSAKTTSSGGIIWSKAYGSPSVDQPIFVAKGSFGEYIITGRSGNVKEGQQDGVAIIIDNEGKLKTSSFIGGPLNDELRSAFFLQEGKYCIALSTESFNATYVDILTAVWSPNNSHVRSAFSEMGLIIEKTDFAMKKSPVIYTHRPLSIRDNLVVKELSPESKAK